MDIVEEYKAKQARDEGAELAAAAKDASWKNFFVSTPPVEQLRAQRNVEDLVLRAVDRKQQLLAETDLKGQELYYKRKQFENEQAQAPLRENLLNAQIERTNATTAAVGVSQRYKEERDARTAQQVGGFYDKLRKLGDPGKKGYREAVVGLASEFPLAVLTPEVREELKASRKAHQTLEEFQGLVAPAGLTVTGASVGADGRPVFRAGVPEKEKPAEPAAPAGVMERYARLNTEIDSHQAKSAEEAKRNTSELEIPNVEYTKSKEWEKAETSRKAIEDAYPGLSRAKTEEVKTEGAPVVAAANPRIALAQRALNDPNASEAHKAAARKLLGQ